MKPFSATREQTNEAIKKYLFHHGFAAVNQTMVAHLSVARNTAYKWYRNHEGMLAAGIDTAHLDLLSAIEKYADGVDATERSEFGSRATLTTGETRPISPGARIFSHYCDLLDDAECCGNVLFRALVELRGQDSRLREEAEWRTLVQVETIRKILRSHGLDHSQQRARLLVSAAVGISTLGTVIPTSNRTATIAALYESVVCASLQ